MRTKQTIGDLDQARLKNIKGFLERGLSGQAIAEKIDLSHNQTCRLIKSLGQNYWEIRRAARRKKVLELFAEGLDQTEASKRLGISPSMVSSIVRHYNLTPLYSRGFKIKKVEQPKKVSVKYDSCLACQRSPIKSKGLGFCESCYQLTRYNTEESFRVRAREFSRINWQRNKEQ